MFFSAATTTAAITAAATATAVCRDGVSHSSTKGVWRKAAVVDLVYFERHRRYVHSFPRRKETKGDRETRARGWGGKEGMEKCSKCYNGTKVVRNIQH